MSLGELIVLGVDAAVLSLFYVMYRDRRSAVEAIKNAPVLEISDSLSSKVVEADNCIPYAVVRGTVKAINQPIISQNAAGQVTGVVQQTLVREHKVRWSSVTRFWTEMQRDVSKSTNVVPFALIGSDDSSSVEVLNPLQAAYLPMVTVYDVFKPTQSGIWDTVTSFFVGERSKGFQHIEDMLTEGTTLTGVGALVLEGGRLRMTPPTNNLRYYLTGETHPSLIKSLESQLKTFKILCAVLGAMGGVVLSLMLYKQYRRYRERVEKEVQRQRLREVITRRNDEVAAETNADVTCLICLTNPREVLILDCGHFCCCADCGQVLNPAICPICRGPIVRLVPAFIS